MTLLPTTFVRYVWATLSTPVTSGIATSAATSSSSRPDVRAAGDEERVVEDRADEQGGDDAERRADEDRRDDERQLRPVGAEQRDDARTEHRGRR